MKAWPSYDFNDMRLEDIPMPHAEPGWVVCKVRILELPERARKSEASSAARAESR